LEGAADQEKWAASPLLDNLRDLHTDFIQQLKANGEDFVERRLAQDISPSKNNLQFNFRDKKRWRSFV
jgi:hypothetical protein